MTISAKEFLYLAENLCSIGDIALEKLRQLGYVRVSYACPFNKDGDGKKVVGLTDSGRAVLDNIINSGKSAEELKEVPVAHFLPD